MSCRVTAYVVVVLAGFASLVLGSLARARAEGEGPVIVVPSRPGVPVVINGRDASYAVVEGDWGLSRPGAVPVTVIGSSPIFPNPVYRGRNSYHPRYGRAPERGRVEVEPPVDRALPDPPESFSRSWSTSSDVTPVNDAPRPSSSRSRQNNSQNNSSDADNVPATITDPETYPQNFNPPVIIDPRRRRP